MYIKISHYGGQFVNFSFNESASFYVIFSDLFPKSLIFLSSVS